MKRSRIATVAAAAAALALLLPGVSSAQVRDEPQLQTIKAVEGVSKPSSLAGLMGVGNGVYAKFDNLRLFQCPAYVCNQGAVYDGLPLPASDVAAICQLPANSPRGNHWVLLLNHANNHVGFADMGDVVPQNGSFTPPWC
ncbi:MAG: hypothetical protein HOY71_19775 [Nonomuraea sp.]|nr:hypothetical protein [Nonomuraea sp.]